MRRFFSKTMKLGTIAFALLFVFSLPVTLLAHDIVGLGAHVGVHHDVGNLSNQNRSISLDPQNSLLVGFSFKLNAYFFFLRTGCDAAFVINRGNVLDGSDKIEHSSFSYLALPLFAGFRFPLKEAGEFYMGAGPAYFIGQGTIELDGGPSEDVETLSLGYGFVTGIEFKLLKLIRLYIEWEYFDARSEPVMNTEGGSYDNFHLDFSGHRILLGVIYYII